jgi:uncharacterized OB-fold protein
MSDKRADSEFIVNGWMRDAAGGRLVLVGQRCAECGVVTFPMTARCSACSSDRVTETTLGPDATLTSITVDRMGTFLGRPHLVGQVQFAEGTFVQGFVAAEIDEPPTVGAGIELVRFEILDRDEPLVTYGFKAKEV